MYRLITAAFVLSSVCVAQNANPSQSNNNQPANNQVQQSSQPKPVEENVWGIPVVLDQSGQVHPKAVVVPKHTSARTISPKSAEATQTPKQGAHNDY
jgi:hypothetical protein